jgi:hypothetical protein
MTPLSLLKRSGAPSNVVDILDKLKDGMFEPVKVRCPLCAWEPHPASRWSCVDCDKPEFFYSSCGRSWNTFETFGQCPGCSHQWQFTACLVCAQWSPHEEWYEEHD